MLVPYVQSNGAWSLSDDQMIDIWNKMVEHKLDKIVFCSAEMRDGDMFLQFMKTPRNVVHVIKNERVDLIAWLNDFGSNFAFGHFCCFPHTFKTTSVDLGRVSFEYWFDFSYDGKNVLDVILGRVPAFNERAIKYVKKLGMTEAGRIPNIRYGDNVHDTSFLYITREEFKNGWNGRKE